MVAVSVKNLRRTRDQRFQRPVTRAISRKSQKWVPMNDYQKNLQFTELPPFSDHSDCSSTLIRMVIVVGFFSMRSFELSLKQLFNVHIFKRIKRQYIACPDGIGLFISQPLFGSGF